MRKYERIDQSLHIAIEVEYSSTHTSLQHPTTVLLSHMHHIYTQQLFNFQKINYLNKKILPIYPVYFELYLVGL